MLAGPGLGRRVLVVDDNRDAADSLALLLRLMGHEARTAYDGPAALQEARAWRPEVALLDIGLAGMTGGSATAPCCRPPAAAAAPCSTTRRASAGSLTSS